MVEKRLDYKFDECIMYIKEIIVVEFFCMINKCYKIIVSVYGL